MEKIREMYSKSWFGEHSPSLFLGKYMLLIGSPIFSMYCDEVAYANELKGKTFIHYLRNVKTYIFLGILLFGTFSFSFFYVMYSSLMELPSILSIFVSLFTIMAFNLLLYGGILLCSYREFIKELYSKTAEESVWKWNDKLFGHKLWAGDKTHRLFEILMKDSSDVQRAKWLMLNFLKEEVENTFSNSSQHTLCSKKPWEAHKYSTFLSENIEHANKIIWFMDTSVFFGTILPTFYLYVIAAIGQIKWKYGMQIYFQGDCSKTSLDECFNKQKIKNKDRSLFSSLLVPDPNLPIENWNGDSGIRMKTIKQYIFPSQINLGFNALIKKNFSWRNIDSEKIHEAYHEVIEKYMVLPHNEAFRRSNANKMRYVCIPSPLIEGDTVSPDKVKDAIIKELKNNKDEVEKTVTAHCKNSIVADGIISTLFTGENANKRKKTIERYMQHHHKILTSALELFLYTCGGESHCKILPLLGGNYDEHIAGYDIGVYDNKIVVKSNQSENAVEPLDLSPRNVTWQYYNSGDDHKLVELLKSEFAAGKNTCDFSIFQKQFTDVAELSLATENSE